VIGPPASLQDAYSNCFLESVYEWGCAARVISSDESREYRVLLLMGHDGERDTLRESCTCRKWRFRGTRCKHISATIIKWTEQRKGAPEGAP